MTRFTKALLLEKTSRERQRRRELRRRMLTLVVLKKRFLAWVCLLICLLFQSVDGEDIQHHRSCRRSIRNTGWWELFWATYDEGRLKKAFRISRETFEFILNSIRPDIEKNTISSLSSAIEHSTLTQTIFPQVMHKCLVFLLQIVLAEGNFSPRRHDTREENIRSWKGAEKVSAKTLFAYATSTMRLLRYI